MATGYTIPVRNGQITEFKDFALQCAHAMGAMMHMRDCSKELPLRHREVSSYHDDQIKASAAEIARISALSPEQRQAEADAAAVEVASRERLRREEDEEGQKRYALMLAFVKDWDPPTPEHHGLKDFMIEQISTSMEWDAPSAATQSIQPVTREDGEAWYWRRLSELAKTVNYHKTARAEEQQRVDAANAWIDALVASL